MPILYNKRLHKPPADAIYVGRGSKWGNDWSHLNSGAATHKGLNSILDAVYHFADWLVNGIDDHAVALRDALVDGELTGKDLICWCVDKDHAGPCHGRVLLTIANAADINDALIDMRRKVEEKRGQYSPRCEGCDKHAF
jgi:hypothetical protein